ncbi:MAG TPA: hypothetical protein VI933_00315 [archaeon]|nr:hypothetical protein [archaeon]
MSELKTVFGVFILIASLSIFVISTSLFYFTQPEVVKANAIESLQKAYQANQPPDKIENLIEESNGKQFIERKSTSGYIFKFYSEKIKQSTQQNIGTYFGEELFSQGYYRNFPSEKTSVFELAVSQYGNGIFMVASIFSFLFSLIGATVLYFNKKKIFEISKYAGISLIIASLPILAIPFFETFLPLPDASGMYSAALQYFLLPLSNTLIFSYSIALISGLLFSTGGAYFERKSVPREIQKTLVVVNSRERNN